MSRNISLAKIRNIAIIAHVDHGKTTFVDTLLKQSDTIKLQTEERLMDSNAIEKERGITIMSKCTSIFWKDHLINILDTPGHADFGSEVERILSMVDGFILIVDAFEGVMPQTKFVLTKAAMYGLKPIIFVNKIDRDVAEPERAYNEVLEEMILLRPDYIESKVFFGSGRDGYASADLQNARSKKDVHEILDAIIEEVPVPKTTSNELQLLVSMVDMDQYFGKLLIGKIYGGTISFGDQIFVVDQHGKKVEQFRVNKLFCFSGIKKIEIESASAGEIVAVSGSKIGTVNYTLGHSEVVRPIPAPEIDPPTLTVTINVNNSPLAGREGKKLTARLIQERLFNEAETNVGIKVEARGESVFVSGRGELQLGILIEQMRREGFEITVSKPEIILKTENGVQKEPIEEVTVNVSNQFSGAVSEAMRMRGADVISFDSNGDNVKMVFHIPTRGLLGYHSKFLTETRGTGILNKRFIGYEKIKSSVQSRINGALISMEAGKATAYAIWKLEDRGIFFISPGEEVYCGMVIGEHKRDSDLEVNPVRMKQLTNIRAAGKDESIILTPPVKYSLQELIGYILDDEELEVTPSSVRIRKKPR